MKTWKIYVTILIFSILLAACSIPQNNNTNSGTDEEHKNNQISEELSNNEDNTTNNNQEVPKDNQEAENDANESNRPTEVEAIFYNSPVFMMGSTASCHENVGYFLEKPQTIYSGYPGDGKLNQIISVYDIADRDTTLYAFRVVFGWPEGEEPEDCPREEHYQKREDYVYDSYVYRHNKLIESMQKKDVWVVKDYPFTKSGVSGGELIEREFFYFDGTDYSVSVVVGTINDILEAFPEGQDIDGYYYRLLPAVRPDAVQAARQKGFTGILNGTNYDEILGTENQVAVTVAVE